MVSVFKVESGDGCSGWKFVCVGERYDGDSGGKVVDMGKVFNGCGGVGYGLEKPGVKGCFVDVVTANVVELGAVGSKM